MRPPRPTIFSAIDVIVDRTSLCARPVPVETACAALDEIAAKGTPAALPYLLPLFVQSKPPSGSALQRALSFFCEEPRSPVTEKAGKVVATLLSRASTTELTLLERAVRESWRGNASLDGQRMLGLASAAKDPSRAVAFAGIASWHADGRVRERAVHQLGKLRNSGGVPYLLLRLDDWVEPVREAASAYLRPKPGADFGTEYVRHLPLVAALEGRRRSARTGVIQEILDNITCPEHAALLRRGIEDSDREVRRHALQIAARAQAIPTRFLVQLAVKDRDTGIRIWGSKLARSALSGPDLDRFVHDARHDPSPALRSAAVSLAGSRGLACADEVLSDAIFDTAACVRHAARFYLSSRATAEFAARYREALKSASGKRLASVIHGLSETGTVADVELIVSFLADPGARVVKASLMAIAHLDRASVMAHAQQALSDGRPGVCKVAASLLRRRLIPSDAAALWEIVRESPHEHARLAALRLASDLGCWPNIALLLRAATSQSEGVRTEAVLQSRAWLHEYHHSLYVPAPPTAPQLEELATLLMQAKPALEAALEGALQGVLKREEGRVRKARS